MKTRTKIIGLLLLVPPILGEVISGSTPPLEFLHPATFFLLVLLYGCGTLLIREIKVRWRVQWSILFIAAAYGILEEGTMIQSCFNLDHGDLGELSGYGLHDEIQ